MSVFVSVVELEKRFGGCSALNRVAASQIDISFPLRIREIAGTPESVPWRQMTPVFPCLSKTPLTAISYPSSPLAADTAAATSSRNAARSAFTRSDRDFTPGGSGL